MRVPDHLHYTPARAVPADALDVEGVSNARIEGEDAFERGAVPAIEELARIGRITKARAQQKQ